jgi:hypothetical protein
MEFGVDYSTSRPDPALLAAHGVAFACRYVAGGSADKHVTDTEIGALHRHGIAVVANFESTAGRARDGRNAGMEDGARARYAMQSLGFPDDRPCYFSVDFDATPGELVTVGDYFRGVAQSMPRRLIGVYGGIRTVLYLRRQMLADWWWQTYAWSGGEVASGVHLHQYSNGHSLAGGDVDYDHSLAVDYGGWGPTMTVQLTADDLKAIADEVISKVKIRVNSATGHTDYTLGEAVENLTHHANAASASADAIGVSLATITRTLATPPVDVGLLAASLVRDPGFAEALATAVAAATEPEPTAREIADAVVTAYGQRLAVAPPQPVA